MLIVERRRMHIIDDDERLGLEHFRSAKSWILGLVEDLGRSR